MRILLSGGGTGGHVYPILAVVEALNEMIEGARQHPTANRLPPGAEPQPNALPAGPQPGPAKARAEVGAVEPARASLPDGVAFRYVGEAGGIEEQLATQAGIPFSAIATGQVRGRALVAAGRSLFRMIRGAAQCAEIIRAFRPQVTFVTGGYVAAPAVWASWRARVPVLIYLPDLTPGQAIRLTSRLADRVAVSFPEVARYFSDKAVVTGYPVRRALLKADKAAARQALGLSNEDPVLLVFGGSRGARSINRALTAALPQLLPRCQVVHVSGWLDWPWVQEVADRLPDGLRGRYHPYVYLHDEMPQALAAADLAVTRAGASTLGEFPVCGLPSILVPYPFAGQHQDANAAYLAQRGAALIIPDGELDRRLAPVVLQLLDAPKERHAMAQAAARLARPDAARNIALELCHLAGY